MIYFDANASVPVRESAKQAIQRALLLDGNPSSPHGTGRKVRQRLDIARKNVAMALGGQEKDVTFTSGATEGNRWWIHALNLLAETRGRPLKVATTSLEHPSMAKPMLQSSAAGLFELFEIPVTKGGQWDLDAIPWAALDVVQTTLAHNETGLIPPLSDIEARIPATALWSVDASQSFARVGAPPQRADFIVVSGHKAGAPSGCGAIMARGAAKNLKPPWLGGGQENGLRPGTEAWLLHVAFGAVCEEIDAIRKANRDLGQKRDAIEKELLSAWPKAEVLFQRQERLPNTTAIVLNEVNGEALRMAVDVSGVCVGFGAACSALAPEPSPALMALGLSSAQARATIRISLPTALSEEDLSNGVSRLAAVGKRLSQR